MNSYNKRDYSMYYKEPYLQDWSIGSCSPNSKISYSSRESVSSTSTPEHHHTDYTENSSSSLIDPIVLSTTILATKSRAIMMPLHQKLLSHNCDDSVPPPTVCYENQPTLISYNLPPPTSPLLSHASTLEPSIFFTHPYYPMSAFDSQQYTSYYQNKQLAPFQNTPQPNIKPDKKKSQSSSEPAFKCTYEDCHKVFSRPYNLKSHMRTHTFERPYECNFYPCGWKFARPHDLKRHELQHTGQKPHGCRFCQKRFARSDALKRHWKVDTHCAHALKEETRLNGGKEIPYARKKRSKNTH